MTRYSLYRNFFDPYAREWQGGNSRWDLIDVVRAAFALRPDGLVWPTDDEGRVTLKLERLTAANGIDHGHAHEALSDVRATIALARLIREKQPKLYDWLFQLRSKQKVMDQIRLLQPMVHISGRFSAARNYVGVVLPLAWHPRNRNALIVCDLHLDPQGLLDLDAETLRQRLYTRRDDLAEGELPVPLKLIHINKCPVVAPLSVLRPEDQQRLALDMTLYQQRALRLSDAQQVWRDKVTDIYAREDFSSSLDPEQQLYDGFIGDRDRRLCEQVRAADPAQLAQEQWPFDDERLPELLFRYRARNFPDTLSLEEQERWRIFCQKRLCAPEWGAPNTLESFVETAAQLTTSATSFQREVLDEWKNHVQALRKRLSL
jgi:exodeoxyribonuclease-1